MFYCRCLNLNTQLKAILNIGFAVIPVVAAYAQNQRVKPNVIILYTDDQGTLDLGSYGANDLHTPHLDKLAEKGVRFTQFYAAPVSSISRASMLTGQFASRTGITGNVGAVGLAHEKETIAERMQQNGYRTALIGKWHLGSDVAYGPNRQGFDYFWGFRGGCIDSYSHFQYWGGPNGHDLWRNEQEIHAPGNFFISDNLTEIKKFITEEKETPFFLYWAVNIPHYPIQPDEKWLHYYAGLPNPRRMYAAFLSTLDEYFGELQLFLAAEGLDRNTIIIFQSDNGHSMEVRAFGGGGYTGGYRGAKFSLFEGGIRVPAIVSWPGVLPEGEVREQTAMNIDWFPTLVELCGLPDEGMEVDGSSLVPLMMDRGKPTPHKILHFDFNDQWAVLKGDWKLIHNARDVSPGNETKIEGLYLLNLTKDPSEKTNFAEEYPFVVEELKNERELFETSLHEKNNTK